MSTSKPVKSIEDLAKEVLDTQEGLKSVDDLKALFETPQPPVAAPVAPLQQVVEPIPAPIAAAPTAPVQPPSAEPPTGEPVLELMPDKFRDRDVQTSVGRMVKSYAEMEAALKREQDEKANMQKILDSLSLQKQPGVQPTIQVPQEEQIEDAQFFEKPLETVMKVAERVAAQKVLQYHADMERSRYIESFRAQHTDFDALRPEILEVLAARPDLDRDQRNLPIVYQMARQLKTKKLEDLRSSLGLHAPTPQPTPTSAPAQAPVDRDKLKEELLEAIRVELLRRKAASGIQGGSAPVNPSDRLNPAPTLKPITPEDQILADMLSSGPKKLAIELG